MRPDSILVVQMYSWSSKFRAHISGSTSAKLFHILRPKIMIEKKTRLQDTYGFDIFSFVVNNSINT